MKIAMVAPCWFSIPPPGYGGIEWVCHWLTEGLVARGHEVTLFGAGEDGTSARFVQTVKRPPAEQLGDPLLEGVHLAKVQAELERARFDVVHDHTALGPLLAGGRNAPTVVTAHGAIDEKTRDFYRALGDRIRLVAISNSQRRLAPELDWFATAYNAIELSGYPFREQKDDFALFLGRMSPQKGVHLAIDAARDARIPLVIAAKCNEAEERNYFKTEIEPRLGRGVAWIGEVDTAAKKDLLARARCLLFPITWEEPFGLVMIEAMACGTPVVALRRGSVPEVVSDNVTGFIADTPDQLAALVGACDQLEPAVCRKHVATHFNVDVMVDAYERVYRDARLSFGGVRMSRKPTTTDLEALQI